MVRRTVLRLEHEHARAQPHIGGHEQRTGLGNVEDVASKGAIAAAMDDQRATYDVSARTAAAAPLLLGVLDNRGTAIAYLGLAMQDG